MPAGEGRMASRDGARFRDREADWRVGPVVYQVLVDRRDEVMVRMNQAGVYPGVHYRDNTDYPMYGYARGSCPRALRSGEPPGPEPAGPAIDRPCASMVTVEAMGSRVSQRIRAGV